MSAGDDRQTRPPEPSGDTETGRMGVSVRVLGTFSVLRDGRPIAVTPAVARLVALLSVRDRPLLRSTVWCTLWPDLPDDRAAATVRNALWRCRSTLGEIVVNAERHLWLEPDVDVDLRRTRNTSAILRAGGLPLTGWAVDDFGGTLLSDWDEDWIVAERERTRQQCMHALEAISRHEVVCGRPSEGIDAGLAAVAIDPLRESAQRVLIEAYLAEGNMSEAHRQLDAYGKVLMGELGLEPSAALSDLVRGVHQPELI